MKVGEGGKGEAGKKRLNFEKIIALSGQGRTRNGWRASPCKKGGTTEGGGRKGGDEGQHKSLKTTKRIKSADEKMRELMGGTTCSTVFYAGGPRRGHSQK